MQNNGNRPSIPPRKIGKETTGINTGKSETGICGR